MHFAPCSLLFVLVSRSLVCPCRANAQQPKLFVGMILILIFAEALALYGLIGKLLHLQHLQSAHARLMSKWHRSTINTKFDALQLASFWLQRQASQLDTKA